MTFGDCGPHRWCPGMKLALDGVPENYEGKGLSVSRGWLGAETKPRTIGVVYRTRARDDGIVLNVCPWCGARIRFDSQDAKPPGEMP